MFILILGLVTIIGLVAFFIQRCASKPISSKSKNINSDSSDSTSSVENFD